MTAMILTCVGIIFGMASWLSDKGYEDE